MTAPVVDRVAVEVLPTFKGFNERLKADVNASVVAAGKDMEKVSQSVGSTTKKMAEQTSMSIAAAGKDMEKVGQTVGRNTEKMAEHTRGLFSSMKESARSMFAVMAPMAVGFGIVEFLKGAVAAAGDLNRIGRQTAAVIASTGSAAHVTKAQVAEYADALSRQTGITTDLIRDSENMLLTFTGVRNEVGKGNDIFTQATATATDMATALKMSGVDAAKQLGKALQDPVKGITALRRAGVNFTEQQKDQIKAMVASGNTLGAQKVILAELSKEFGGSAAAQSSMGSKMKAAYHEVEVAVGQKLLPVMKAFSQWMLTVAIPAFMHMFEEAEKGKGVIGSLKLMLGTLFTTLRPLIGMVLSFAKQGWAILGDVLEHQVSPALKAVGEWMGSHSVLMRSIIVGVLAMVAAYKVYKIAIAAAATAQAIFTGVMKAFDAATKATVIGIIILAIIALVAAFIYAYKHSKTFRDIIDSVGRIAARVGKDIYQFFINLYHVGVTVWHALETAGEAVAKFFISIWNKISGFLRTWGPLIVLVLAPFIAIPILIIKHWGQISGFFIGIWHAIKPFFDLVAERALALWHNAMYPAWTAIRAIIQIVMVFMELAIKGMIIVLKALGEAAMWLWRNIFVHVWEGIKLVVAITIAEIKLVLNGLVWFWQHVLAPLAMWLWHNIFEMVFGGIKMAVSAAIGDVKLVLQGLVWFWEHVLKPAAEALWHHVIEPIFHGVRDTIKDVWENGIKKVFQALVDFVTKTIPDKFHDGVSTIERWWNTLKHIAAVPVSFIVDTVINDAIIGSINAVADFFNLPTHVGRVKNPVAGMAEGGRIPGPLSDKDNKLIWAATGEHIMPTKRTRHWLPVLESIRIHDRLPNGLATYAGGGVVGLINDAAGWIKDRVHLGDITKKFGSKAFVKDIAGAPSYLADKFLGWVKSLIKRLIDDVKSFLGSAARTLFGQTTVGSQKILTGGAPGFPPWPSSPGAQRSDSGVWKSIVNLVQSTGIPYNFGNAYRAGDPLWHGSGRAVDFMGFDQHRLADFFMSIQPRVLELIHRTSRDYAVTRGVNKGSFNNSLMEEHRNHLHIAMDNGVGRLARGRNIVDNNTGRPENIVSTDLLDVLKRILAAIEHVGPDVGRELGTVGQRARQIARST